ncbi:hypothetical protein UFOVP71_346 [uncultured Caudovirales phage]|uniref:Uncharacterized protein n=1 Tax=uncultured Caudovirales phage TaxID=2100421 RepID=A0A6J5TA51_9CAUD|nr:hypothetical protein UFOVP71_346 [uncultured Caudovirales phage]
MLSFIKKLFGSKPVEVQAEVPYKVDAAPVATPAMEVADLPAFPVEAPAKKAKAKKTGATSAPKKPRTPKAK